MLLLTTSWFLHCYMYGFLGPRPPRITHGRVVSSTRSRSLRHHLKEVLSCCGVIAARRKNKPDRQSLQWHAVSLKNDPGLGLQILQTISIRIRLHPPPKPLVMNHKCTNAKLESLQLTTLILQTSIDEKLKGKYTPEQLRAHDWTETAWQLWWTTRQAFLC